MPTGRNARLVLTLAIIVLVLGVFMFWLMSEGSGSGADGGRILSVEEYISQNITELSPVDAQLGGTFYVTEINAEGGKGIVEYEDGHMAYTADFEYTVDEEEGGVRITSFIVRP